MNHTEIQRRSTIELKARMFIEITELGLIKY